MAKIYRIGVIGSTGRGNYGHGLDTTWFDVPQAEVVAVADDDPDGLAKAAKRLKVERAFSDYRQMLDKEKLDIVAVCPRWVDQHRDMIVAAAERAVHIYVEKPFCRTLAEADEIVDACERTHVKLAIGHPTHYSPKLATLKRLIDAGAIGEVLEYRARGKEDRRGGGEDLWVLGTHVLDMVRYLGGHPRWCFARVTQGGEAVAKKHIAPGAEGIGPLAGDSVSAVYGLEGGATAHFQSRRHMAGRPSRYGLQIFGSEGVFEIVEGTMPPVKFLGDPSWSPGRTGSEWQDVSSAGIGQPEPLAGKEYEARHLLAIRDLLDAIENNREGFDSIHVARGVTEMIVSVFESHRLGRPVELPLENRENPLTLLK